MLPLEYFSGMTVKSSRPHLQGRPQVILYFHHSQEGDHLGIKREAQDHLLAQTPFYLIHA